MKKYLVVFEAPCVGTNEELVHMETDQQASEWAWATSVNNKYYVAGSYDIYRLEYDNTNHTHTLTPVNEIELWEAEAQ